MFILKYLFAWSFIFNFLIFQYILNLMAVGDDFFEFGNRKALCG